jgi:hypothetical protein
MGDFMKKYGIWIEDPKGLENGYWECISPTPVVALFDNKKEAFCHRNISDCYRPWKTHQVREYSSS